MTRQSNSPTRIFGRGFGLSLGIMLIAAATMLLSSISVYAAAGVVSGRLWNDLNNNQAQNSGEPGLPNVTVNLRFAGADGTLGTADDVFSAQVTDNDGNYAFTGLDAGNYQVTIDYLSGPLLWGFDINTANEPLTVALGLDEVRNNASFGFVYGGKSNIGNYVWNDLSANGDWVDEGAEFSAGLPAVSLSLYLEMDGNGTFSPGLGGDLLALTTSTDGTGKYGFPTTANGNEFWVRVDPSNFLPGGALEGYIFTNGNGVAYDPDNPTFVPLTQFVQTYNLADFGFVLPADLQVVKSDSPDPVQSGNALTYTLAVTNHGPATALNVVVTDTLPGAVSFVSAVPGAPDCTESGGVLTCDLGDLAASTTTTVTVRVTVAPGAAGQIVNRATVSSDTYDTVPGNNQDTEPTLVVNPAIAVAKSASPTVILANAPVVYTFLVTNPGDVPLATVGMSDNTCTPVTFSSGDTNNNTLLDPNETWRYTCTTPVAVDTINTITATGQPSDVNGNPLPQIPPVTDTDTADVNVVAPAIKIVKDVNLPVMYVGETAQYTLTVTNPGDVPLHNVGVTDNTCSPVIFGGGDTNSNDLLETTESWIYHCEMPVSATFTNTATASGQPSTPGGTPLPGISPVTDQDQATVRVIDPKIRIVKTPSATIINPGDPVTYTYAVTNPGNDPLSAVSVGDNKCAPVTFGSGDTNSNNLLDLNESWTFSCQTTLTQDTTNLATATGTDTLGNPVSNTATAFVDVVIAGLQIDKTASAVTVYAGTTVTYTYIVQNTGTDTVNSVVVVDNQCNTVTYLGGDTGNDDLLAPGEVWTYQCVEPLSVDTVNVVQVTGKDELGNPLEEQAQATVDVINPAIHVGKHADRTTILAGDTVIYRFDVANPGDDPLANVILSDDQCSPITGPSGDNGNNLLDPGEVWSYACTATNVLTDTVNIASVSGNDSLGNPVSDQDTEIVDVVAPAIDVVKVATPNVILSGDLVAFDFLVSNQGDVALSTITISDDKCAPITGPNPAGDVNGNGLLDVGETWAYACVTPVAVDTTNVVNVSGQPSDPAGTPFPGIGPVTDTGSADVDVVAPAISLVKDVSSPTIYVGESVIYTFTVTNPGDVTLRTINLTDNQCAPLTFVGGDANNNGRLEISETWLYTCQTALSADTVNTANVSGRPSDPTGALYPNLPPVSATDSESVNVIKPGIQVVKSVDLTTINPGDTVVYTFDVTNTGDDPLTNVAVSDDKCSPLTGPNPAGDVNSNGKLDPTETWQYSCTTILSVDTTNTATATGDDSLGNPVSDTDAAHVNVVIAGIQVDKSASAPIVYAGDLVIYTYNVRNTGLDPISSVLVDDNLCAPAAYQGGDTNTDAILNPGEVWVYTCSTSLSQDTVNVVTASGKDPLNQPVTDDATASVNVINPAINVVKSVDRTVILSGTLVEYTFIVTNPGDDPLTSVALSDNKCAPLVRQSGDANSNSILEPGEIWTFTCQTALTTDTVNVVTATAKDSLNNPVQATDSETVDVVAPQIAVDKAANRTVILSGDLVRYTFLVSNLGDTPLASVSVSDDKCSPISNPDPAGDGNANGRLDPGEVWAYSCTTAINNNTVNTVTVNGQPTDGNGVPLPGINPVTAQDTESVIVVGPAIHIEKTVSPTVVYANEGVVYSFTVTNPGDMPLRDVVVSDNQCAPLSFLGGDSNSNGRLDVGESWQYSCAATPGADVLNTASVVGRPSAADGSLLPGFSPVNDTDTAEVNVITPGITVVKTASEIAVAPGTPVTYTYAVSNSGDDPLTNVAVSDDTCSPVSRITVDANGLLDPGESWTFLCSAILTKDTTNVATATATDSLGNPISGNDTEYVEVVQAAIDLVKSVDRSVIYAGETVTYTLDVFNIGNDPIFSVVLTDNKCSTLTGPTGDLNNDSILDVTETWRYSCTQPLSVDTTNTAVVVAEDLLGQPLTDSDAAAVNVINPKIQVVKSADHTVMLPNGQVKYTYLVTNPGDDPLASVAVSDDKCAPLIFVGGDGNGSGRLEPGEIWTYICTTNLSQTTVNTVTAGAVDTLGNPVSATATATVTVVNPAINVAKSADPLFVLAGQTVQYTYLVTNPGDVALANVSLADDTCPSPSYQGGDTNTSGLLEPGETWTFACSTTVADDTTNTVTASGQPSDPTGVFLPGIDPVQDQDTAFVDRVAPAVLLTKVASASQVYSGTTVIYTYTATNPGDVSLSGVNLVDDKCSPAAFVSGDNGNNLLDPGESWVYTCAASLTQDTLNTATVSGQPSTPAGQPLPGLDPVDNTATAFVDVITPGLTVIKLASAAQVLAGDSVIYTFRATNTGNTPLDNVAVSDDKCAPVTRVSADSNNLLDPGESWTFRCTAVLTQDTTNVATASATDPLGGPVDDTDDAFVNVIIAGLRVTKVASAATVHANSPVTYTYQAVNTGTDPIQNVVVSDNKCATVTYVSGDDGDNLLESGETWLYRCVANLAVDTTNIVTLSGEDTLGNPVTPDQASRTVDVINPAINVVKSVDKTVIISGSTVIYTYLVTNPGDDPLGTVTISDDKCSPLLFSGGDANSSSHLDPGENWLYSCTTALSVDTVNVVTVGGTDSLGQPISDTDTVSVDVLHPAINVVKSASPTVLIAGQSVVYTFTVTNPGDAPLATVRVSDNTCAPTVYRSGDTNNNSRLEPGETWIYTCARTVNQDTTNVVTVSGQPTDPSGTLVPGAAPVGDTDSLSVDVVAPAVLLDKQVNATVIYANGQVEYTYLVTNTGDTPLVNLVVTDDKLGQICTIPGLLASGSSQTCTKIAALAVDTLNKGTVTGQPSDNAGVPLPGIAPVTHADTAQVDVINPAIKLVKSANLTQVLPGTLVTYTLVATNLGDSPLTNVVVADPKCGTVTRITVDGNGQLDPGESWTFTCGAVITQDTINSATVTAQDLLGGSVGATDTANVLVINPDVRILKSANPAVVVAGGQVTFTLVVNNLSTNPLSNVVVADNQCALTFLGGDTNNNSLLEPSETWTYRCVRPVSQDTVNTASVSGQPSDGSGTPLPGVPPVTDTHQATVDVVAPSIQLTKSASVAQVVPNTPVTYTMVATNNGDTPIANVVVSDPKCGTVTRLTVDGNGLLDPGESWTFRCVATITQDTVNTATVSGHPSDNAGTPLPGIPPVGDTATATVDVISTDIRILKSANPAVVVAGGQVTFTMVVENLGSNPLSSVVVTDDQCTVTFVGGDTNNNNLMEPTETWTYRCVKPIGQDTVNTASVIGQPSDSGGNPLPGIPPVSDTDTATVDVVNPAIQVAKTVSLNGVCPGVDSLSVTLGTAVTYCYLVINSGDTAMSNITVSDDKLGSICTIAGPLAPGISQTCTATATITQDVTNVGTVSGQPSDNTGTPLPGIPPVGDTDTATVDVISAGIRITKSASPAVVRAGGLVTFTLLVQNLGTNPIANVVVTDNQCTVTFVGGDANNNSLMEPTETWTYRCVKPIGQDTVNTASVIGQPSDPQGNPLPGIPPVNDTDTATVDVINPAIEIVKTANVTETLVGQVVIYTYQVRNTGDASLNSVSVFDNRCAVVFRINTDLNGLLDPGETWTYNCVHTVLSTDPTPLVNVADVVATDPTGGTVTDQDTATVNIVTPPNLVATKAASLAVAKPGDTLTYRIIITNTGGSAATGVILNDTPDVNTTIVAGSVSATPVGTVVVGNTPGDTSVRVNIGTLAPGASVTVTFDVTIADPFLGAQDQVQNQGVIGSNELPDLPTDDPTTVVDGDVTITPIESSPPVLKASKRVSGTDDRDLSNSITPGDVIHYEIVLSNQGLGTATDVFFLDTPDNNTTLVVGSVVVSQGSVQSGNTTGDASVAVTIPSMKSGDSVVIAFDVTINNPLPSGVTQVVNQGVVQSNETTPQVTDDPTLPGDTDPTVTDVVVTLPDLTVVKRNTLFTDADSSGGLSAGDSMQYEIVITNNSGTPATDVVFNDTPDINTTLIVGTVTASQGTIVLGNNPGNTTVRVNVGTIPGGQDVTIRLWVRINLNLPSTVVAIVNQGLVSSLELPDLPTDDPATGGQGDPTQVPIQQIFKLYMPLLLNQPAAVITPTPTPSPTPTPTPTPTPEAGTDNFVGDPIDGMIHPKAIAVHQGQNMLFITSRDNNQLLKVNPLGNTVVATAATGDEPWGVVVNENTNRVYVSNYASADVWVYDANTLALIKKIRLGNPGEVQPALMEILPGIDTVAVVVRGNGGGGSVAIIEGVTLKQMVGATGAGTYGIAVDRVRNRIIVSNRDGGNVRVIYRTEFGQWMNDGQNFTNSDRRVPFEVEYNPTNQKLYMLYVINMDWYVDIWEVRANDWFWKVGTVSVGNSGGARDSDVGGTGLAVDTTTGNVFVANSKDNTVSVISGSSNQVTTTLATGADPFHITINPATRMVYVALRNVNRLVSFLDRY